MRWYPWAIQQLVSTHQFPHSPKMPRSVQICILGGCSRPTQTKVSRSVQICIFEGEEVQANSNPKCQDLSKSALGSPGQLKPKVPRSVQIYIGGGDPGQIKLKVPRSVQICIWGVIQANSNPMCQDLSKSAFLRGRGSRPTQTQSAKICLNLHFLGGGDPGQIKPKVPRSVQMCIWGGWSKPTQTQSAKICPNLHLGGWWFRPTFLKYLSGGTQEIFNTNSASQILVTGMW